jgi:hypothetical protein
MSQFTSIGTEAFFSVRPKYGSAQGGSLRVHKSSYFLFFVFDKPIAELYQLDRNTIVEVTPKEDGLTVRFVREKAPARATDEEVLKAADDIN